MKWVTRLLGMLIGVGIALLGGYISGHDCWHRGSDAFALYVVSVGFALIGTLIGSWPKDPFDDNGLGGRSGIACKG